MSPAGWFVRTLQSATVSMLVYDGQSDKLKCKGSYINPDRLGCDFYGNQELRAVIKDIAIYEFIYYYRKKGNEAARFADFIESSIYGKTSKTLTFTSGQFDAISKTWDLPGFQDSYSAYKANILTEDYAIDDLSVSGQYFCELLQHGSQLINRDRITDLEREPPERVRFSDVLHNIGIAIPNIFLYIGLPLFCTDRYVGILRIAFSKNDLGQLRIIEGVGQKPNSIPAYRLTEEYAERLRNFAQLISLHMETLYFLDAYKSLTNLKIELPKLSRVCEVITEILNCRGVMIRIKKPETGKLEVGGFSEMMKGYIRFIETEYEGVEELQSKEFSKSLVDIFANEKYDTYRLRAINFRIRDAGSNEFETTEYYYTADQDLKKNTNRRILRDFEPRYNSKLLDLNIDEVVVLPIPYVEDAFMILTNTKHRIFSAFDIEMVLLAASRTGSEIKQIEDIEKTKLVEKQQVFMSSMRIIVHQFGTLVSTASNQVDNILRERLFRSDHDTASVTGYDLDKLRKKIAEAGSVISQSKRQVLRSNRIIQLVENKPLLVQKKRIDNFKRYLVNKCKDFNFSAYSMKKLHVWLVDAGDSLKAFETDEDLFDEVMYSLLDNAIKYSFKAEDMKKRVPGFDENVYNSDGNILVHYNSQFDKLSVAVSSWGNTIQHHEKEKVFGNYERGSNSKETIGSGIGLYLVKRIVEALNGKVEIKIGKDRTTFSLLFNR